MLDDDAIERYARQIVVPGIGASGQEKLLASTVAVVGGARGCEQAALYLAAAGTGVLRWPAPAEVRGAGATRGDEAGSLPDGPRGDAGPPGGLAAVLRRSAAVVVADTGLLDESSRRDLLASGLPLCWYATDAAGFTSGIHPGAPLPAAGSTLPRPADDAVHDAAACDAASAACAILLGLPARTGPFRFES